jgi:hypothetical protein
LAKSEDMRDSLKSISISETQIDNLKAFFEKLMKEKGLLPSTVLLD